jgi:hypothetical protein
MITMQQIKDSKNVSYNCVFVDFGESDGSLDDHTIGVGEGKIILSGVHHSYSGNAFLKRSGLVLSVPSEFKYHKPFDIAKTPTMMSERLTEVLAEVGDTVFFEVNVKQWCEHNNMIFKTDDGNNVFAIPYRHLICALKKGTEEVVMLNGKIMVARTIDNTEEKFKSEHLVLGETAFTNSKNQWCEVVYVSNNEGYEGTFERDDYVYWNRKGQNLSKGFQVLVKKYASFELQNATKEVKHIDSLKDVYSVERKKIIAWRENDESDIKPYGMYAKVELDAEHKENKDLYEQHETGIWLKKKSVFYKGKVVDAGSGYHTTGIGDTVLFNNRGGNIEIFDNFAFVRYDWIDQDRTFAESINFKK